MRPCGMYASRALGRTGRMENDRGLQDYLGTQGLVLGKSAYRLPTSSKKEKPRYVLHSGVSFADLVPER